MAKKLTLILVPLALITYLIYSWVSSLPEISPLSDPDVEVTSQNGEELFWGRGRCHVCHRIGERGYALRGPNLGDSKDGAIIPVRAQQRARQLGLTSGTAYLIQCVAQPDAFVVSGYNNEMPEVFRPPISLFPSEIQAIIFYLQSLDGDSALNEIRLPQRLLAFYQKPGKIVGVRPTGNPKTGRELFFDVQGPAACAACHVARNAENQPEGSTIGPDLTAIASIRTPEYILQKIVKPDSNIVSGYEQVLIKTELNKFAVGIIKHETEDSIILVDRDNAETTFSKKEIQSVIKKNASIMPGNYAQLLSEDQMDDLLAFLLTLKDQY